MRKAILIFGPPGAGKGTQADLVAQELNLVHFDTGRYLNELIKSKKDPSRKIKTGIKTGGLVESSFVLQVVKKQLKKISQAGFGVILSGSPRSIPEAFGDKKRKGLIPFLAKLYGRENLVIFKLEIPPQESIDRNSKRMVCSVCERSHILKVRLNSCPFCGGKLIRRSDDNPKIIKIRLEKYCAETEPIFTELKKHGFKVHKIDGNSKPAVVFRSITRRLK